jgi:hypothetical protein
MEITLEQIDTTILMLRARAADRARELVTLGVNPYTQELKPVHARLMQHIYRITCIRNGLIAERTAGNYLN